MSRTVHARFWDTHHRGDAAAAAARTVSVGFVAGLLALRRVPALLFGLPFGALLVTFAQLTLAAAVQSLPALAGVDQRV